MSVAVSSAEEGRLPPAGWALGFESEEAGSGSALDERIRSGFSGAAARRFMEALEVERDTAARLLGVSTRTLARRLAEGRLKPAELDRLYRYAHLLERAASVLGGAEAARTWLKEPQWGLGDRVLLSFAETEAGAREVEDLLGRIEHGVLA
jgi:putative toxin-antitoxin system antitoxin component (TIGR02293 family)